MFNAKFLLFAPIQGQFAVLIASGLLFWLGIGDPGCYSQTVVEPALANPVSPGSPLSFGAGGVIAAPGVVGTPGVEPFAPPVSTDSVANRVQGVLPRELILPPPSDEAKRRASRFVTAEINPELPLNLVLGRPKVLRLADTPLRIYVPDEESFVLKQLTNVQAANWLLPACGLARLR